MTYGFSPEKIPESYVKVTWQERQERIPADYGVPERSNGPDVERCDELDLIENWGELGISPIF